MGQVTGVAALMNAVQITGPLLVVVAAAVAK
jgi:hypothetical protein